MSSVHFCLLMIVRNEASIIYRALDSIKNVIGSYYIHDTGSTDGTQEIIQTFGTLNNIPGFVESREWKNFGANKTDLIQSARTHSDERISKATYYVWLDADEVWISDRSNPLSYLTLEDSNKLFEKLESVTTADIFMILTLYGGLEYRRWNLCRNNQVYKWLQPVHEYFVGETRNSTHFIDNVYLLARKEGNSAKNPDRYKKDVEMFIDFLKENPNEPRATFYLAQSSEGLDEELANQTYKSRILLGGYYEEKYISCLRLGRRLKDESERIKYLFQGTLINPNRLECYYELMMIYYNKKDHKKAVSFGMMAPENRVAKSDFLFVETGIYNYSFDLHFGVSCFYAELYELGMKVTKRALEFVGLPTHIRGTLEANLGFFKTKLEKPVIRHTKCDKVSDESPTAIIIDNFYKNPDEVRALALSLNMEIKGNFPGARTKSCLYEGMKEKFESIIGKKITYFPEGPTSYNGSFQLCTKDMHSWYHSDNTIYSCVVFLTKDPPPHGGTKLCVHKETGIRFRNGDPKIEEVLNKDSRNDDAWIVLDRIGNVYNRAIIFKGKHNHISDEYFGTSLQDGRLFQTFFFSVEE